MLSFGFVLLKKMLIFIQTEITKQTIAQQICTTDFITVHQTAIKWFTMKNDRMVNVCMNETSIYSAETRCSKKSNKHPENTMQRDYNSLLN